MGVTTTKTNKPLNPRGNDQSPLAFNRAKLYSGKALDFDGVNDSVTISDNAAVDFGTSDFSIAFIMQSDTAGYGRLIDKRSGTSGYTLSVGTSKELVLELNNGAGSAGFFTSSVYADGKLKHVVISADRDGNASFYINGVLDETIDISSKAGNLDSTSDLFIGADAPSGVGLYYNGLIAGVKMYSTALTAAQVADLYNNPEKVVPTGVDNTALKLWLPMMEGAGTTAYDGSGNGNHGTISGATYVNGVGAPVAQSAVMDWNKGSNKLPDSSDLQNATYWLEGGDVQTESGYTAPDGTNTAYKVSGTNDVLVNQGVSLSSDYRAIWARTTSGTGTAQLLSHNSNTNNTFNLTEQWQKFSVDSSNSTGGINFYVVDFRGSGTLNEVIVWQPHLSTNESVLVPTIGTAQTTPVLLPQGLTTGRDITGVNLFENVRKQGALNLDGNSWAEVHDNASLDITSAITLETWVYFDGTNDKGILGRWNTSANKRSYLLYNNGTKFRFYVSSDGTTNLNQQNNTDISTGWNHIVGVYDGAKIYTYLNGSVDGSQNYSSDIDANDSVIEIARYAGDIDKANTNDIAQPRIYNRALTAEEVQRNYNAGKNIYTN